jgi:hypothetical protein
LPVQVQVDFQTENFQRWVERVKREAPKVHDELLDRSGSLIADAMWMKTPVRTGFLRSSILIQRSPETVTVGPTASYAPYVEWGTGPHIIEPVNASALAFEIGGQTVFAKRVMHPGFPGRFFVKGAGEECLPKIHELVLNLYCQLFYGEV